MKHWSILVILLIGLIMFSCTKKVEIATSRSEPQETPIIDTSESRAKADTDMKAKQEAANAKATSAYKKAKEAALAANADLIQRPIDKRVLPEDLRKDGIVTFDICINRDGKVVSTKYNRAKSTLTEAAIISAAMTAMKKTTFKPDNSALEKECGQWRVYFSNPRNYRYKNGIDFDSIGTVQREVAKHVFPKDLNKSGKVVFNICINREGKVIYAKYNRKKSTLTDRDTVSDMQTAIKKTIFDPDMSAPCRECGQWTISSAEE